MNSETDRMQSTYTDSKQTKSQYWEGEETQISTSKKQASYNRFLLGKKAFSQMDCHWV